MKIARIVVAVAGLVVLGVYGAVSLRPSLDPWPKLDTRPTAQGRLDIRFLGTSSLSMSDGTDRIMIDGYLSRPSLPSLLMRPLRPDQARIETSLARAHIDSLSALMVAHTHFDHALDALPLAVRFKARLMGSPALADIAKTHPRAPPVEVFQPARPVTVGRLTITPFETPHAPGDVAHGASSTGFHHPARARDWPMGASYSWLIQWGECRILVVPSAGDIGPRLASAKADVLFLGIGQLGRRDLGAIDAYWADTVAASGAGLVIPIHWDDFTRPLDKPLRPLPYVADRFDRTMGRLQALAQRDGVRLALPPAFDALHLPPPCA